MEIKPKFLITYESNMKSQEKLKIILFKWKKKTHKIAKSGGMANEYLEGQW